MREEANVGKLSASRKGLVNRRGPATVKEPPLNVEQVKKHLRKGLSVSVAEAGRQTMPGKGSEPVLARVLDVFGDEQKAAHWLLSPLGILDDVSPAQALLRKGGRERVEAILTRIEHNIPS